MVIFKDEIILVYLFINLEPLIAQIFLTEQVRVVKVDLQREI